MNERQFKKRIAIANIFYDNTHNDYYRGFLEGCEQAFKTKPINTLQATANAFDLGYAHGLIGRAVQYQFENE